MDIFEKTKNFVKFLQNLRNFFHLIPLPVINSFKSFSGFGRFSIS
jgi:hypothetical protein